MTRFGKKHLIMAATVAALAITVVALTNLHEAGAQNGPPQNPGAPVNIVSPLPLPVTIIGVAPEKPSDVVTLTTETPSTFCTGVNRLNIIATRILPDGTSEPFQIPAGKVLVVTGIDWTSIRTPLSVPGTTQLTVSLGASRNVFTDSTIIGAGTLGAGGVQGVSFGGKASVVPNLIVKPGIQLCATNDNSSSAGVVVHGFLASDR